MAGQARVEDRVEQPYVGIAGRVASEAEFRDAVDRGFPELFGWLQENGEPPSGPPFIRYLEVDQEGKPLEFELAVPIAAAASGDGRVRAGALPAGRYVTFLHVGPYNHAEVPDLEAARAEVLGWAEERGIEVASSKTQQGTAFQAYVEHYITDASREPDWSRWQTELAYLVDES